MRRIGFVVNPIAGMGGRVGLKGTDDVVKMAIELGARPVAHTKACETLRALRERLERTKVPVRIQWITCSGRMGADCLNDAGFQRFRVSYDAGAETTAKDTQNCVRQFMKLGVELVLFCGGDGTARDVSRVTRQATPILGIPSGVKMYSGVFGTNASRTAEILLGFLEGRLSLSKADILDLDEESYRRGEWVVRLYDSAFTPFEPTFTQAAKMQITETTEKDVKEAIAEYLFEEIASRPDVLVLLGPGSTVETIGKRLSIDKTLLGVDAIAAGKLVGKDLNECRILDLLDRFREHWLVLSPIGAQGFVLGRGNLQLTPEVVRKIGRQNVIVVATPGKLARTPVLRFDTGDALLDAALAEKGYIPVVIGYGLRRLVKVQI